MSEKAIKLINDLRRDIWIDVMFTPEKNAEDDSLKALMEYIAELEAERRWRIIADGELPEDRATILAAFKNREILTATYYKHYEGFGGVENYWHIEGWHSGNGIQWVTLPEPPIVYRKEREE